MNLRPLDRAFVALPYPYDILLPAAVWLLLCSVLLAVLARAVRRYGSHAAQRALRTGLWCGAADAALWFGTIAARGFNEGEAPAWLAWIEAPLSAASSVFDGVLWNMVGVSAVAQPERLLKIIRWNESLAVLFASVLNEAAFVALVVAAAVSGLEAWRGPRKSSARTAGTTPER